MPEDINFLPPELRPKEKTKSTTADKPAPEFSRPLVADKPTVPKKKHRGFFSKLLSRMRSAQQRTNGGQKQAGVADERVELLKNITNKSSAKKQDAKIAPAPPPVAPPVAPPAPSLPPQANKPSAPARRPFIGTNLLKGQEFIFFDWRQLLLMHGGVVLATLVVVGAMWGYLAYLQHRESAEGAAVLQQVEQRETQLASLRRQVAEFESLRAKARLIPGMLKGHVYWSGFFDYLEQNTLPGVYYLGFDGDLSGVYELTGRARDFQTFSAQTKLWQEESTYTQHSSVQSMTVVSAGGSQDEVARPRQETEFDMTLQVDTGIFYQ